MDLSHRFTVPTPVEETWAHFQDLGALAECFPGASIGDYDEQDFSGSVKVKLGPIALVYNGSGTFVEKDEDTHRFVVKAKGKDKRGNGTAGATVTLAMADADGSTDVEVLTDLSVTGKPAQFGRGVMQDVSDKLLGQFVTCLEETLSASPPPAPAAGSAASESAVAAAAPAQADTDTVSGAASGDEAQGEPTVVGTSPAAPATTGSEQVDPAPGRPAPAPSGSNVDDSLDLGAAVLPILLRTYGPQAAIAVVVALVAYLLGRRR